MGVTSEKEDQVFLESVAQGCERHLHMSEFLKAGIRTFRGKHKAEYKGM